MTDALPQPADRSPGSLAHWAGVTVRYPYAARDAVGPVTLDIRAGQRVLLLGPSGSGKSTLLQTLTGIVPKSVPAAVGGRISVGGTTVAERPPSGWAGQVAQFFQDADRTLTGLTVFDEIAFVLENMGLPSQQIKSRVQGAMREVGLPNDWRERRTSTLSGGEKQLVALAATLVAGAPLFVVDEPTASLSPAVAKRVYDLLLRPDRKGATLIVDHRLDQMIGAIDKVAVLGDAGIFIAEGSPGKLFRAHGDRLDRLGIWTPLASRLDRALQRVDLAPTVPPLGMAALRQHLQNLPVTQRSKARNVLERVVSPRRRARATGEVVAKLDRAACAPLFGPTVLTDVSMRLHAGEVVGIVGPNGAGKSTLGASLAGLLRLKAGTREGALGAIAFQNPENQFLEASVLDEVASALPKGVAREHILSVLEKWALGHCVRQHPFELSQGEKRRLALACLTATDRWQLLVLDEPTSGLDARGVSMIAKAVDALAGNGRAIAIITHDMDFALSVCDRLIVIAEGSLFADGTPAEIVRDRDVMVRADLAEPTILPVLDWLERVPC